MSEARPILFSGPMIRALLAGKKTQTRRVLKDQPPSWATSCQQPTMLNALQQWVPSGLWAWSEEEQDPPRPLQRWPINEDGDHFWLKPRFSVGDRLWVREAWRAMKAVDAIAPRDLTSRAPITYEADGNPLGGRLRASMHMPRWASRITLTVTEVRAERLQDITLRDAFAEGCAIRHIDLFGAEGEQRNEIGRAYYRSVWEAINGPGSWRDNPWLFAYTFTVHRDNIDKIVRA